DGDGWALGAMFRPGGFRPLVDVPMRSLVDQRVPGAELFGAAADALATAIVHATGDGERVALFERFLLERLQPERLPSEPTVGEQLSDLVERAVAGDRPVTRSTELAQRFGVSTRTLQRLFAEHVGVGPKVMLDR